MIKALSLAAALAILPLSAAAADPQEAEVSEAATAAEAAIEAAAERFEARMEEFGERAEALGADESLTEDQRELRIAALSARGLTGPERAPGLRRPRPRQRRFRPGCAPWPGRP